MNIETGEICRTPDEIRRAVAEHGDGKVVPVSDRVASLVEKGRAVEAQESRSTSTSTKLTCGLKWIEDRWHNNGVPIHAGTGWALLTPGGFWLIVRIESADGGRRLIAHHDIHGFIFTREIDTRHDVLTPRRPAVT